MALEPLLCQNSFSRKIFSLPVWNSEENHQFHRLGEISGEQSRTPAESLVLLVWGWEFQRRFEEKRRMINQERSRVFQRGNHQELLGFTGVWLF